MVDGLRHLGRCRATSMLDPHVWKVQVDLHRDVVEPMALLRGKEEPRGSSDLKDPNGALLRDVEEL